MSNELINDHPIKDGGNLRPRPHSLTSKSLSRTKMTLCHRERPLSSDLLVAKCRPGQLRRAAIICGSLMSHLLGLLVVYVRMTSGIISYGGCHHARVR